MFSRSAAMSSSLTAVLTAAVLAQFSSVPEFWPAIPPVN